MVSVQSDISEQVACQERLGNEQSILQSAIAAMPSGISIKDPRGRYMAFNQKIVELSDLPDGMIRVNGPFEDVARYQAGRGDHGDGTVEALVRRGSTSCRPLTSRSTRRHWRPGVRWSCGAIESQARSGTGVACEDPLPRQYES